MNKNSKYEENKVENENQIGVSNSNVFTDCNEVDFDSMLVLEKSFIKSKIVYFEDNLLYSSKNRTVKLRKFTVEDSNELILAIQNKGFIDTIFFYKILNDSLFIKDKDDNTWEYKISLNMVKNYNLDEILWSKSSYFHSFDFHTSMMIVKVEDINNMMTSNHIAKNKNIKVTEFFINNFKKLIAFRYKCEYYYLN